MRVCGGHTNRYRKRGALMLQRTLLAILPIIISACSSASLVESTTLARKDLPEYSVVLYYPRDWSVSRGDFFHFTAETNLDDDQKVVFHYRGLEKVKKDRDSKRQYARGWYAAIQLSYRNWTYISQTSDDDDSEGTFRFEGTYLKEGVLLRKLGVLRFRGNHVHAFYYTAPDQEFEAYRPLFEKLDSMHRYSMDEAGT